MLGLALKGAGDAKPDAFRLLGGCDSDTSSAYAQNDGHVVSLRLEPRNLRHFRLV